MNDGAWPSGGILIEWLSISALAPYGYAVRNPFVKPDIAFNCSATEGDDIVRRDIVIAE
jgi:hypothetical protein